MGTDQSTVHTNQWQQLQDLDELRSHARSHNLKQSCERVTAASAQHHGAYLNFGTCAHIQERLHHAEDHAESGGCIDDASLAKHLWIVVGIQGGDLAQHLLHAAHLLDAHPCSQV